MSGNPDLGKSLALTNSYSRPGSLGIFIWVKECHGKWQLLHKNMG